MVFRRAILLLVKIIRRGEPGANECTTITFEHDVKVEGQPMKAGTYGIFMAMGAENVTIIFSKQNEAWGSLAMTKKMMY